MKVKQLPSKVKKLPKAEPVVLGGTVGGGLSAILLPLLPSLWAALESYGFNVTPEMQNLVGAILAIGLPVLTAWVARHFVTTLEDPKNNEGVSLVPVFQDQQGD